MAITVECSCGKTFRVRDEFSGRKGKCPACGAIVAIAAPAAELPTMPALPTMPVMPATRANPAARSATDPSTLFPPPRARPKAEGGDTKFAIFFTGFFTPGRIALLILLIGIPGVMVFLELGPIKARDEWKKASEQGVDDVRDVVTKAIRVYSAQNGIYDPRRSSLHAPEAKEVVFHDTVVMIRMPDRAGFIGVVSSSGRFQGSYGTRTGEVDAQVPLAGTTLHVTGRVKKGQIEAEIDGKQAEMPVLPPLPPEVE